MQFVYNGYACVEIFFFLSGFVLVFIHLRNSKQLAHQDQLTDKPSALLRVPSLSFYAGIRAFRFLIPIVGLLSLQFLWPMLGSGPIFSKYTTQLLDACRANSWKNFLFINNYDRTNDICLLHTWFISADIQLHLLAYPLIVLFKFNEKLGILFNLVLIALGKVMIFN